MIEVRLLLKEDKVTKAGKEERRSQEGARGKARARQGAKQNRREGKKAIATERGDRTSPGEQLQLIVVIPKRERKGE